MAQRISRRKLAAYVADRLGDAKTARAALKEAAAYLVDTRRTRELELLVRDIEDALAVRGTVIADVTSAHPLSSTLKSEITKLVGAKTLSLRESIDPDVLGGIRVDIPGKRYDATVRRKLIALKAKQL
jgi:F-type H+-transporting ATPase subunit delta